MTYDLWEPYVRRGRDDAYYPRFGRIATIAGIFVSLGTSLIASSYKNIENHILSTFDAPLFATVIIGMFWRRMTPWAGSFGLVAGTLGAAATYVLYRTDVIAFRSDLEQSF